MIKEDLVGQRFGKLLVLKKVPHEGYSSYYLCKCDCGKEKVIRGSHLKTGKIRSCTCLRNNMITKHGLTNTRLHRLWRGIKNRCLNEKNPEYCYYGGRGITICQEWLDKDNGFINFYNWAMNNGYQDNLTIDRIDVDGDYEPSNCRWANREEQANNTRRNHFIEFNGEQYTLSQFAKKYNVNKKTLEYRVKHNLDLIRGKNG